MTQDFSGTGTPRDPPGTTSLVGGSVAFISGVVLAILAFIAASFGILPALALLVVALPLAYWGKKKLRRDAPQIRRDTGNPPA